MDMKNSLLCSAALLLCVVIVNFPPAEADCGGFLASCTNPSIVPTAVLEASCQGSPNATTTITLDSHLGNSNGNLVPGSGFTSSCHAIGGYTVPKNVGYWIEAHCVDGSGKAQFTQFDLNTHVANSKGALAWHNC